MNLLSPTLFLCLAIMCYRVACIRQRYFGLQKVHVNKTSKEWDSSQRPNSFRCARICTWMLMCVSFFQNQVRNECLVSFRIWDDYQLSPMAEYKYYVTKHQGKIQRLACHAPPLPDLDEFNARSPDVGEWRCENGFHSFGGHPILTCNKRMNEWKVMKRRTSCVQPNRVKTIYFAVARRVGNRRFRTIKVCFRRYKLIQSFSIRIYHNKKYVTDIHASKTEVYTSMESVHGIIDSIEKCRLHEAHVTKFKFTYVYVDVRGRNFKLRMPRYGLSTGYHILGNPGIKYLQVVCVEAPVYIKLLQ